jgi:hypothetical protein
MTASIDIPLDMKLVYFCRHILERQNLFSSLEGRARRRAEERYADCPAVPPGGIERVIAIDDFDRERFEKEKGFDTPFVLKGLFGGRVLEWDYLRESCGDAVVPVHPSAKLGDRWQYQTTSQMRLGDAMREMERGAALSVVSTSNVFNGRAELLAALKPDVIASKFGVHIVRHEMFVAGAGTGSAFHCAVGGNFFVMVCGRKRWILVKPSDSFAMYPTIGRNMGSAYVGSPINSETYESEQMERYPLFSKVSKFTVTLEPGDVLFVPSWWWHEVKNLEPAVGVPLRSWLGGRNNFFLLLNILSTYGLKYLSRALVSRITGSKKWMMTDGIPQDSFGGSRLRRS